VQFTHHIVTQGAYIMPDRIITDDEADWSILKLANEKHKWSIC